MKIYLCLICQLYPECNYFLKHKYFNFAISELYSTNYQKLKRYDQFEHKQNYNFKPLLCYHNISKNLKNFQKSQNLLQIWLYIFPDFVPGWYIIKIYEPIASSCCALNFVTIKISDIRRNQLPTVECFIPHSWPTDNLKYILRRMEQTGVYLLISLRGRVK